MQPNIGGPVDGIRESVHRKYDRAIQRSRDGIQKLRAKPIFCGMVHGIDEKADLLSLSPCDSSGWTGFCKKPAWDHDENKR
jgi:hypothetical protein